MSTRQTVDPRTARPDAEAVVSWLRAHGLLDHFADDALHCIAAITTELAFPAATRVFAEGDRGDALYILRSGQATLRKRNAFGADQVVNALGPGTIVGEMSLIDNQPRSLTLQTETDATFYVVAGTDFQTLLHTVPGVNHGTLRLLSDRIRVTTRQLVEDDVLDNHPDMVILTDQEFRVNGINRQARALLGLCPDEEPTAAILGKLRALLAEVRARAGDPTPFHFVMLKPERLYLSIHVNPLRKRGFLHGYLIELRDITAARDMGRRGLEIAAFVIHRLPDLVAQVHKQSQAHAAEIGAPCHAHGRIRELQRQVNKLVAFTELEAGPLRIDRETVRPDEVVQQQIDAQRPMLAEKLLMVVPRLRFGASKITADRDWFTKLVNILIGNAAKYALRGTNVVVTTERTAADRFRCRIENDCPTVLTEDETRRFFDLERQLDEFETGKSSDIGLELPLARHIVDAHHGKIWIEATNSHRFVIVFEI